MRKHRKKVGTEVELKKKRERYQHQIEMRKTEKEKEIDQSSRIRNADREKIVHWKLAKEYSKIPLEFAKMKTEKKF